MKSQIEDSGNGKILKLHGELTIRNADKLKIILDEMLNTVGSLIINVESVKEIDLSCLQLLCAAHRTSIEQNRLFEIEHNWSVSLKEVIRVAGLSRNTGCHFNVKSQCLWA